MKRTAKNFRLALAAAICVTFGFAAVLATSCDTTSTTKDDPKTETPGGNENPDDNTDPIDSETTELIVNGSFAAPFAEPWLLWTGEGGSAAAAIDAGALKVSVASAGTAPWHVQAVQDGRTMPDGDYTVSFRAKSAAARPINVQVGNGASGWTEFTAAHTYALTTSWTAYTFTFTKAAPTFSSGKLVFELGAVTGDGTLATDVFIDDVSLLYDGVIGGTDPEPKVIAYPATNADTWTPGEGWSLAWEDGFNDGTFDTNVWTRQRMMDPPNNEWQQYPGGTDATYAYEENGYMILKAAKTGASYADNNFMSARVISNPGGQDSASGTDGKLFKYGKIAARIQVPYGKGIWPAFWMLGDNINETGGSTTWPECGEIDIMEIGEGTKANYGQGTTLGTLHHDPTVENVPFNWNNEILPSAEHTLPNGEFFAEKFHVFEIEWDEQSIVWKLDGTKIGERSISEATRSEFHENFYVIFNIAVGGNFTATPDSSTPFPQYMYIDWIRHYTKQ